MSPTTEDLLIQLSFSIYENPGVYALLIGSGVSRAAEVPTGWEITLDLIRRVALVQGEEEQTDWVAWYQEKNGKEPNYSELVSELGLLPDERRSILHEYIEPSREDREEGRKTPTQAHYAIADLVQAGFFRVIITTNFDRLLENALREKGVEPTIVASVDALKGVEPLAHTKCYLLKLHGDYKDARILNTDKELSSYPQEYDKLLDRIFDDYGLLVCGWSGEWDQALCEAIMRNPSGRYSTFWTALRTLGLGTVAEKLIAHRNGHLITIEDADSFFVKIRDHIEKFSRTHKKKPQTIDLLVKSTKQYIAEPEYRIQLDELLTSETQSFLEKLESADLPVEGNSSAEEFQRHVDTYEITIEPLARIVGVLGRWGDKEEWKIVIDIVRSILNYADRERNGFTSLLSLRSYPAVLLVAAYGIGAIRAERWEVLHHFLTGTVRSSYGTGTEPIVEELFLNSWKGGRDSFWQNIEVLARRKTPFSEHLYPLLAQWGESFVGVVSDFEELYETWEVLCSITYCERYTLEEIQRSISNHNYAPMPVGRSGWNHGNCILELIQSEDTKKSLLEAGFAKGQSEFLDAAIVNFQRVAINIQHKLY